MIKIAESLVASGFSTMGLSGLVVAMGCELAERPGIGGIEGRPGRTGAGLEQRTSGRRWRAGRRFS